MTKPRSGRSKEKDIDKDTVVAYHEFIQGRIHGELNGISIGPGRWLCRIALWVFLFGVASCITGILVISLRHRHVYLWDWNAQFVGPFFVILFLICSGIAVFLVMLAKKRTNFYRGDLAFRPIGDYGVAVVHKSKLTYDDQKKTELKSGTTPHNVRHPGRLDPNDRGYRGNDSKSRGYDNRGYRRENNSPDKPDSRDRRDDRDRPDERRIREDRGQRGPRDDRRREDDRERRDQSGDPNQERRRPPDDRDRRRPPDDRDRRRPPDDRDRRRPPDDRDRRRPPDDRDRRRTPEDDQRREERRRQYEQEKRRRYEEDRRRAELRKQAEAESQGPEGGSEERGVDVGGTRTMQITTTVKVQRPLQETDESEL